jgi:phosphonate degradation associated HDIG domain protein
MHHVDLIFDLFRQRGASEYFGEAVSQCGHALETALFAERDQADESLIVAALLHDIGHLLTGKEGMAEKGIDEGHEVSGCVWLTSYFSPAITQPVRLHVHAKRYLCHKHPGYRTRLSPASVLSLDLQGGPFTEREARQFEAQPGAQSAIRLRRWDDRAKIPGLQVPALEHYREMLYRQSIR